jgi:hypothetical protein
LVPTQNPNAAVTLLAKRICNAEFLPAGQTHTTACITSMPSTSHAPWLTPLQAELQCSGLFTFIDIRIPASITTTRISSDLRAQQLRYASNKGARYLIEVAELHKPAPHLLAEITDTSSGLVVLRKIAPINE